MNSGVNMLCFSASYAIALALELYGLWRRPLWRRWAGIAAGMAGIAAHTWYLVKRIGDQPAAPLASRHDWCLAVAWLLAVIYLAMAVYYPRRSFGLFLLPVMLGLIGASHWAALEPLASADSQRFWGQFHGVLLMLGAVAVSLGFVTGLMYLLQSRRLKHKQPLDSRFRLPSLEWLEAVNSRSLGAATLLVALGFFSGVVARLASRGEAGVPWNDSVVLSLGAMLLWLVGAELFRWAYPAARRGRKVAYLTLAAFVFLLLTLATFTADDSFHQTSPVDEVRAARQHVPWNDPAVASLYCEHRQPSASRRCGGRTWISG